MIRLIASDLDGTLLEPNGMLPEGIFEIIEELEALGIRFAAASGRQFGNLKRLFLPMADRMAFVCENGAVNVIDGEVIGVVPIAMALAESIIADILAAGMNLLISGKHTSYVMDTNRVFSDYMVYGLRNTVTMVGDLRDISEPILKVSGQIDTGVAPFAPALIASWSDKLNAAISGDEWFDFTASNKGMGMQMLMDRLGLKADEVAAFGDNFNDESMLDLVGYPFLMESAHPLLCKQGVVRIKKVIPILREIVRKKGSL